VALPGNDVIKGHAKRSQPVGDAAKQPPKKTVREARFGQPDCAHNFIDEGFAESRYFWVYTLHGCPWIKLFFFNKILSTITPFPGS